MERARAEFAAARFSVVLVTFGSAEGAAAWLQETGSELRLVRDPDRALYTQLGLPRSVSRAWSTATLHWCASQQAAGREAGPATPPGWQDGDHLQMGGNFSLQCPSGRLVLARPSSTAVDRPSVQSVLQQL